MLNDRFNINDIPNINLCYNHTTACIVGGGGKGVISLVIENSGGEGYFTTFLVEGFSM